MSGPLISIVTPTYNRADFLGEAIDSVLAQTYPKFEHIIIDDGSTDATPQLVRKYLAEDPRVRYFQQENQGQSVARNVGIEKSRGEFICFLDSDNAWLPNKLERSIEVFNAHPDIDVLYADVITIDEKGREVSRKNMRRFSGRIVPQMLKDNCVSMNTTMTRRRCFDENGGFSGQWRVADDYDLWLRFSAYYNFHYVPEFFACYRVMADQISSDKQRRFATNEKILRAFLREHGKKVSWFEARNGMCAFFTRKGRYLASTGRWRAALGSYARALAYNPVHPGPFRALVKLALRGAG